MATPSLSSLTACCWSTLALSRAEIDGALRLAVERHPGAAIVTSCQRTEAYAFGPCDCPAPARLHGAEAIFHLAEVAAGLHSVVLGETQVMGQVRDGFAAARGPLRRVGDRAIAAARELRRATDFNSHAGALLDRGLKTAGVRAYGALLVLGAGQMGRLVAQRAPRLGFAQVVVASRTPPAWLTGETWVPLAETSSLAGVSVVAGCLGSGASARTADDLPPAALYLDLGTPRNFAGHFHAPVLDLALLMADEERRPHATRRRRQLRKELRARLQPSLAELDRVAPDAVGLLRAEVERVRRRELARMSRLHPEIAPATLDIMTRALVNQLFHAPSMRLREKADDALGRELAALFASVE